MVRSYLKKVWNVCQALSRQESQSVLYFFWDYLWCYLRYRCLIRHYYYGSFFRKRGFERKQCVTYSKALRIDRLFNEQSFVHVLNNKVEFNRFFSKFIQRKWLYGVEMTEEDFLSFVNNVKIGGG